MRLDALIAGLRQRGVELFPEGDVIRFRAPRGVMTPVDRDLLGKHKAEILVFLRAEDRAHRPAADPSTPEGSDRDLADRGGVPEVTPQVAAQKSQKSQKDTAGPNSAICANSATTHRVVKGKKSPGPLGPGGFDPVVTISGRAFPYFFWKQERLGGELIGFDTETALIVDHEIPKLVLASASTGEEHCLIRPDRLARFIERHRDRHFVLFNCAFDYWVVHKFVADHREEKALKTWERMVDEGRIHDAMLLDELIRLGQSDIYPRPRNLAEVALEYAGLEVDKCDPYRLRYAEIVGADWDTIERGFFEYAIKDPIVTLAAYKAMQPQALRILETHGYDPSRCG